MMAEQTLSPHSLKDELASAEPPVLLHLLSDEAFAEERIPGSRHACVYEVAFPEKVAELIADKSRPVVVYGQNDHFGAARLGVEKLRAAGYRQVARLEGGLDGWKSAGFPTGGDGSAAAQVPDGRHAIDTEKSVFRWIGQNLFNQHHGRIAFQGGHLEYQSGQLTSGTAVLDMTRITCSDLRGDKSHDSLIAHLESDDFFSVADYPTARFSLLRVERLDIIGPGEPNLRISGMVQLRGRDQEIQFDAQQTSLGGRLGLQGRFDLDRTQFGSVYGSGKFFERLGQHVVNDKISLSFQLICAV